MIVLVENCLELLQQLKSLHDEASVGGVQGEVVVSPESRDGVSVAPPQTVGVWQEHPAPHHLQCLPTGALRQHGQDRGHTVGGEKDVPLVLLLDHGVQSLAEPLRCLSHHLHLLHVLNIRAGAHLPAELNRDEIALSDDKECCQAGYQARHNPYDGCYLEADFVLLRSRLSDCSCNV